MLVTLSVCDRGKHLFHQGKLPYGNTASDVTPKLEKRNLVMKTPYVNKILGLKLTDETILNLLKRNRYGAEQTTPGTINVTIPCYRVDVMHQVDIVEDIAIMFGYNNITPCWPQMITFEG